MTTPSFLTSPNTSLIATHASLRTTPNYHHLSPPKTPLTPQHQLQCPFPPTAELHHVSTTTMELKVTSVMMTLPTHNTILNSKHHMLGIHGDLLKSSPAHILNAILVGTNAVRLAHQFSLLTPDTFINQYRATCKFFITSQQHTNKTIQWAIGQHRQQQNQHTRARTTITIHWTIPKLTLPTIPTTPPLEKS